MAEDRIRYKGAGPDRDLDSAALILLARLRRLDPCCAWNALAKHVLGVSCMTLAGSFDPEFSDESIDRNGRGAASSVVGLFECSTCSFVEKIALGEGGVSTSASASLMLRDDRELSEAMEGVGDEGRFTPWNESGRRSLSPSPSTSRRTSSSTDFWSKEPASRSVTIGVGILKGENSIPDRVWCKLSEPAFKVVWRVNAPFWTPYIDENDRNTPMLTRQTIQERIIRVNHIC